MNQINKELYKNLEAEERLEDFVINKKTYKRTGNFIFIDKEDDELVEALNKHNEQNKSTLKLYLVVAEHTQDDPETDKGEPEHDDEGKLILDKWNEKEVVKYGKETYNLELEESSKKDELLKAIYAAYDENLKKEEETGEDTEIVTEEAEGNEN